MNRLRHAAAALVVMGMLFSVTLQIYDSFKEGYSITEQDLVNDKSIMQRLEELQLVQGLVGITVAIDELQPPANDPDLLGALTAAAIGILQVIKGILIFPLDFFPILGDYYNVPGIVSTGLGVLVNIYVLFIILSASLGKDL